MPTYGDDEDPNPEPGETSIGSEVEVIHGETIDVRINHKKEVPKIKTELNVSVELMGSAQPGYDNRRLGVDVVVILDVSSSMSCNERRQCLNTSMEFLISKLCPTDRMSVVKLSTSAERLCPLRLLTQDAQADIENMVKCLEVSTEDGCGNLAAGLGEALKVLKDRTYFKGRKPALMLLSSSEATYDAAQVPLSHIPVHAFAITCDFAHEVLRELASKSNGGTFSVLDFKKTESISDLSPIFFQCLAKLLGVVAEDLKLSLTPLKENYANGTETVIKAEIESITTKVDAKYHPQAESDDTGSITISLGHLYRQERCKILVKLLLPFAKDEVNVRVLQLTYSYRDGVESCNGGPIEVTVSRMALASLRKRGSTGDAGDSEHLAKRIRPGSGNVFRPSRPSEYNGGYVFQRPQRHGPYLFAPSHRTIKTLPDQHGASTGKNIDRFNADKHNIQSLNKNAQDNRSKTADKDKKKR